MQSQTARNTWALLLLSLVVAATFGRPLHGPFIYDDYSAIVENESVRQIWPLSVPLNPPKERSFSGRPFVNLLTAVNYYFGGYDPSGYRALNLAIHALNAWLLYLLLRFTLKRSELVAEDAIAPEALALGVALVWAVHPLQTETVCYITQRTELVMSTCYLATLFFSAKYLTTDSGLANKSWLAAAVLASLAGMASKEVMVTAPVLVLIYDRAFIHGSFRESIRRGWPLYLGLALTWLLLAYLIIPSPRSDSAGFHLGVSAVDYWMTQAKVLTIYVRLCFWPSPLSVYYEIPYLTSLGEAWMYVLPVALAIVATLVALWRNWPSGVLGASFFLILSPTLVVPIVTEVVAERRMYLPLAALISGLVVGGYRLLPATRRTAKVPLAACLAIAICLAAASFVRLGEFKDQLSFWSTIVRQHPTFAMARFNLGVSLKNANRLEEAVEHYAEAVRLDPDDADYRNNYASTLRRMRRYAEAEQQAKAALELNPDMYEARLNLGLVYADRGRPEQAIPHLERALQQKPDSHGIRIHLAQALEDIGEYDSAIALCLETVQGFPEDVEVRFRLGNLYLLAKRPEAAIEHFQKAVEIVPVYGDAWNNLGSSYFQSDRPGDAVRCYEEVVRLDANSVVGHYNLAEARVAAGDVEAARADVTRARELAVVQNNQELLKIIDQWLTEHPAAE